MRMNTLVAALGLVIAGAVTAEAQNVTYDYDKTADFSKIKTYAWVHGQELQDELNHKRVVTAIDAQLAAKGLTRVEATGSPDVLVAYNAGFDRNLQIEGSSMDWGGPLYRGNRNGSARVAEIVTGTLVIGLLDPETKSVLWRGVATRDIDVKASPEKRDKNVNKAVAKLFDHYPPKR
jgi:uncharacterized protein DUF4136